jgi:hypothetical protein
MRPAIETGKLYSEHRSLASLWLKSQDRNSKRRIIFHPGCPAGSSDFNLWTGFACSRETAARDAQAREAGAAAGELVWQQVGPLRQQVEVPAITWQEDARVFTDHIGQIWCQGDEELSTYVLDWLAHLLQFPEKKLGVALLVRGDHGAGKGVVMTLMREMLGRAHFSSFVNLGAMTGQYNGEFLERCVLAMVDEVHTHKEFDMSKVKALITEDTHTVEQKYVAPYQIDSFTNFIFLSNSDHMMRVEAGERRFLALDVSGRYAGAETAESRRYFEKLLALGRNGRASSVAHFLYSRDISSFRPRCLPQSAATMQQKLLSLEHVQRWWISCLREGTVPCADSYRAAANKPQEHAADPWSLWRHKPSVHAQYKKWCSDVGAQAAEDNSFWSKLARCALFKNERKTDGGTRRRVPVVSFASHKDSVEHFACKVLHVSVKMFASWLNNESHAASAAAAAAVPAPPLNAQPYAPLFSPPLPPRTPPPADEADGANDHAAMQVLQQDYSAFAPDEDAAAASAV